MQQAKVLVCLIAICASAFASYDHHEEDNHGDDSYKFEYGVEDLHTGDIKTHHETKTGKEVSGVYSLKEADGTTRIVRYTAGPHTGFNAVVERVGVAQHPIQQQSSHQTAHLDTQAGLIADSGVGAQDGLYAAGHGWTGVQEQEYELQGHNLFGGAYYGQQQQQEQHW